MGHKSGSQPNPYAPGGASIAQKLAMPIAQHFAGYNPQQGNPNAIAMNPAYIPGADPRQFTQTMPVQSQPMQQGGSPDMRRQMMAQMLASRPFQNPNLTASNQAHMNQMAY